MVEELYKGFTVACVVLLPTLSYVLTYYYLKYCDDNPKYRIVLLMDETYRIQESTYIPFCWKTLCSEHRDLYSARRYRDEYLLKPKVEDKPDSKIKAVIEK